MKRTTLSTASSLVIDWSLRLALLLVPVYFAWFRENFSVFDINKTLALRCLVTVALIAWLVRFCVEAKTRWSANRLTALLGLGAIALFSISTVWAVHPGISFFGSYERQQGLFNIIHYFLLFFLIISEIDSRAKAKQLITALLIGSGFVAAYGLTQAMGLDIYRWGESSQARIFSTFGQPNFLGHYVATLLPLTVYAIIYIAKKFWQRLLVAVLLVVQLFCLICTYSRSAWVALASAVVVWGVWELWRRGRKRLVMGVAIFGIVVGFLLVFSPLRQTLIGYLREPGRGSFSVRISTFLDPFAESGRTRQNYWQAAVAIMQEAPVGRQLFGFGPEGQADAFAPQYRPEWAFYEYINSYPDRAHNFILDILLQYGIVGLVVFAAFVLTIFARLLSEAKRQTGDAYWLALSLAVALIAYTVNNIFSFSLTGMNVVLYGLLGIAAVVGNGFISREREWHFFQPLSRWCMAAALCLLMGIMLYAHAIRPFIADHYYFKAKIAEARQDCRELLDTMETVLEWYPSSTYYQQMYLHLGTNCFSAASNETGRRQLATNLVTEASTIPESERQYRTLIYLAQMYSIVGFETDHAYYTQAEELYRYLIAQSPSITTNYQDYGRLLLWQGKNDEAIAVFKQGVAAAPDYTAGPTWHIQPIIEQTAYLYDLIGNAYLEKKDYNEAESWLKKSVATRPDATGPYKKLADLSYKRGDLQSAIKYNKAAFRFEPEKSLWPLSLAMLYKESGDRQQALDYARQAQALEKDDTRIKELIDELTRAK